jgi:hypothetical protein
VLVINKDRYTTVAAQLTLTNFLPGTEAVARSFGIAEDEATRTNSPVPGAQDIATNALVVGPRFTAAFPPYSVTLLTIPPAAPGLTATRSGGQFGLLVQGQAQVRYLLQSSTNLTTWSAEATNILAGNTWYVTTNLSQPRKYWRAAWLP